MNLFYRMYARIYQHIFRDVTFFLPIHEPKLLEGPNSLLRLPKLIVEHEISKVLLVTDAGLVKTGLLCPLLLGLEEAKVETIVYDKTVPNPTIDNIEEALTLYLSNQCQGIIAFGGGSPMDVAKAVGARVSHPKKSIPQMKGMLKLTKKIPPLFVIPTTAGTGSETTVCAVISNPQTHEKYAINDPHLIPLYAVLDPVLTEKLPKKITSTTGIDALTHAVEAYIGRSNTPHTKAMALSAIRLIYNNLLKSYENPGDLEARGNMQKAAYQAGVAFTRAFIGYVHAVAHTLGGFYQIPHGLANAVVLPLVLERYGKPASKKLAQLADAVGITEPSDSTEQKASRFIASIRELNQKMEIPTNFKGIIKESDLPRLAKQAIHEANPTYPVPRIMDIDEITEIFRALL